jgi:hypothetical protein
VKIKLKKMKKSMIKAFAVGLGITANVFLPGQVMAQVPSYVPTNGLVGWWPFNGNANDESGNGNNGTVNGATLTADRFGNTNKAYSFDGVDDYISCYPILGINEVSISIWFKKDGLGGHLVSQNNWINAQSVSFASAYEKISSVFSVGCNNGNCSNPGSQVGTSVPYNLNSDWHHRITTISVNGELNDYLDGELINTSSIANFQWCTSVSSILKFGAWWNSDIQSWDGKLDDIGIWNRALTECEIQDLYNAQLGSFSNTAVTVNPTNATIGSNATLTVNSSVSNIQWQSNPSNVGWQNVPNNANYSGGNTNALTVYNVQLANHNQPFRAIVNSGGCIDTSTVAQIIIGDTCLTTVTDTLIINTTLSLPAPNNENTILIYPNPASDHITIDNGNYTAMAGYSIKIENNAGQQVFQSAINKAQFYVDLSTWSGNGLYFVHLIDPQNNTVTVRKIVLQ